MFYWGVLHHATSKQQYLMVEHLIQRGCDVNLQNMDKETALHIACERNNAQMIEILVKADDIDCNIKNSAGVSFSFISFLTS